MTPDIGRGQPCGKSDLESPRLTTRVPSPNPTDIRNTPGKYINPCPWQERACKAPADKPKPAPVLGLMYKNMRNRNNKLEDQSSQRPSSFPSWWVAENSTIHRVSDLFLALRLTPTHLLGLQVLVEQEQRRFVGLGGSHDSEHPLTSLVMRCLFDTVSMETPYRGEGCRWLDISIPWQ